MIGMPEKRPPLNVYPISQAKKTIRPLERESIIGTSFNRMGGDEYSQTRRRNINVIIVCRILKLNDVTAMMRIVVIFAAVVTKSWCSGASIPPSRPFSILRGFIMSVS